MVATWKKIREGLEHVGLTGRADRREPVVRTHLCRRCGQKITTELTFVRHCHVCGTVLPPSAHR